MNQIHHQHQTILQKMMKLIKKMMDLHNLKLLILHSLKILTLLKRKLLSIHKKKRTIRNWLTATTTHATDSSSTDEQSRIADSCLINLSNAACCVQPRDYGCAQNDIDEDFLNEIEDRGPTLINLQPRRGVVTQQTQIQEETETTHLIYQMNNSSLLEHGLRE